MNQSNEDKVIDVCIDIGSREWIHISFQDDKMPFVRERVSETSKELVAQCLFNYFKEYLNENRRDIQRGVSSSNN